MENRSQILTVSMRPVYVRALDVLAAEADDGSAKRSPVVRKLIEHEMRRKFGANWKRELACLQPTG